MKAARAKGDGLEIVARICGFALIFTRLYRNKFRLLRSDTIMAKATKELPVILITNDDGVTAPGIKNLIESVKDLGQIVVVAPDKPQSGMGHAITIGNPLRLYPVNIFE